MTEAKTYHYVITVQAANPNTHGGILIGTYSNIMEWTGTRCDALANRFDYACATLGVNPRIAYIMCWSFEPNELQ